jgi:hypothetical protein
MSGRSSNAKRKRHDYALKVICNALGGKGIRNKRAYDQALQAMLASFIVPALRPTRKLPSGAGTGIRTSTVTVYEPKFTPLRYIAAALERDGVVSLTGEIMLHLALLRRVQQKCDEARQKANRSKGNPVNGGVAAQAWAHEKRTAIHVAVTETEALSVLSPALREGIEDYLGAARGGLKLMDSATVPIPPWAQQQEDHADHTKRQEVGT